MPHGMIREVIPASSSEVFRLIHDYKRRLEWDTLLQEAYLTPGHDEAKLGAVSVCRGKMILGGIALMTQYIVFRPGETASIKMVNRPPFFETFAATIRHRDLGDATSSVEYTLEFTAHPRWLRWVLHPIMARLFVLETGKRLRALKAYFADNARQM